MLVILPPSPALARAHEGTSERAPARRAKRAGPWSHGPRHALVEAAGLSPAPLSKPSDRLFIRLDDFAAILGRPGGLSTARRWGRLHTENGRPLWRDRSGATTDGEHRR